MSSAEPGVASNQHHAAFAGCRLPRGVSRRTEIGLASRAERAHPRPVPTGVAPMSTTPLRGTRLAEGGHVSARRNLSSQPWELGFDTLMTTLSHLDDLESRTPNTGPCSFACRFPIPTTEGRRRCRGWSCMKRFGRANRDEGLGMRALAGRFGVHRRTVRQALLSATPAERKVPERTSPAFGPVEGHDPPVAER